MIVLSEDKDVEKSPLYTKPSSLCTSSTRPLFAASFLPGSSLALRRHFNALNDLEKAPAFCEEVLEFEVLRLTALAFEPWRHSTCGMPACLLALSLTPSPVSTKGCSLSCLSFCLRASCSVATSLT